MNLSSPVGSIAFKGKQRTTGDLRPKRRSVPLLYNFGYNAARLAYADAQSRGNRGVDVVARR